MARNNATVDRIQAVWNILGGEDGVDRLISGELEVVQKSHIIDLDADPFVPDGWKVEEHRRGGQFEWDPARVSLYLSEGQKVRGVGGHKLRKELQVQPVLNANLLDYFLKNTFLIPREWKCEKVAFWGTVYRHWRGGNFGIRFLGWTGQKWDWEFAWLDDAWGSRAAVIFVN